MACVHPFRVDAEARIMKRLIQFMLDEASNESRKEAWPQISMPRMTAGVLPTEAAVLITPVNVSHCARTRCRSVDVIKAAHAASGRRTGIGWRGHIILIRLVR